MEGTKQDGNKLLNVFELQKLGVIGLLVFFVNFLMDTTREDNAGLKEEMKSVRSAVTELSIQTKITGLKVDSNSAKLQEVVKATKDEDAAKRSESDLIQEKISDLDRRIYQLEK